VYGKEKNRIRKAHNPLILSIAGPVNNGEVVLPEKFYCVLGFYPRTPAVLEAHCNCHPAPERARDKAGCRHEATRIADAGISKPGTIREVDWPGPGDRKLALSRSPRTGLSRQNFDLLPWIACTNP